MKMTRAMLALCCVIVTAAAAWAWTDGGGADAVDEGVAERVRFAAFDVILLAGDEGVGGEPGVAVAAWQIEIRDPGDVATLIGVEGGEAGGVWADAPAYDPRALHGVDGETAMIVLANYTLDADPPLVGGRAIVRVARIHVELRGERASVDDLAVRLVAAATPGGDEVSVEARLLRASAGEGGETKADNGEDDS